MVIAVTHYNGEVFPHFGRSPEIALYLVDDDTQNVTKRIISVGENGHEGIALLLCDVQADYLLCGGIGQGAVNALYSVGIQVFPGCSGNTDELVKQFLSGNIKQIIGPTCHCHDNEEEHSCHCHHEEQTCDCENDGCSCGEDEGCSCHCHDN